MSDETTPEQHNEPGSVFGNLPSSRPGTRSPRRDRSATTKGASATASTAKAAKARTATAKTSRTKATPKARPKLAPQAEPEPQPQAPVEESAAQQPGAQDPRSGVEDLAWAGIAAAAEAATLGVRLASRAMGAVRDSVDRR